MRPEEVLVPAQCENPVKTSEVEDLDVPSALETSKQRTCFRSNGPILKFVCHFQSFETLLSGIDLVERGGGF